MAAVDSVQNTQQTSSTTSSSDSSSTTKSSDSSSVDFASLLQSILGTSGKTQVSEEELFAGVVEAEMSGLKGEEAATKFHSALSAKQTAGTGPHGYFSFEDGAKEVLTEFVSDGTLTSDEANQIYSDSFAAAQLDDKTDALFDDKGGEGDITISVSSLEQAISSAAALLDQTASGAKASAALRQLSEASTGWSYKTGGAGTGTTAGTGATGSGQVSATNAPDGQKFDGSGGFLFKPVSDNEGKLAIILPNELLGLVDKVSLVDDAGNEIETGSFTSTGDNGTNEKYIFSKEGGEYPQNLTVSVTLNDGSTVTYSIPDPSQRYD